MKKLLPIIIIISVAAVWGFFSNQKASEPEKITAQKTSEEQAIANKNSQLPTNNFETKQTSNISKQNTQAAKVVTTKDDLPELPANPYEQFMQAAKPQNSLDNLGRNELSDDQVIRRNEYFEKLSQQLKDMQGQTEPNDPPAETAQSESGLSAEGNALGGIGIPPEEGEPQLVEEYAPPAEEIPQEDFIPTEEDMIPEDVIE